MSTNQVRIDEKIKKSAKKVLDSLGMDMSSAVKIYLHQIVESQGIPFRLLTANGLTMQQEKEILQASAEAKKGINVSGPFEGKEAIDHLKNLRK
jgi:DNA-damage-inducible protein J